MEELKQYSPNAYDHLMAANVDNELKTSLGNSLRQITHEDLYDKNAIAMDHTKYSHVPYSEYTDVQHERHRGVDAWLSEAARLTAVAADELAQVPEEGKRVTESDVFSRARDIALQEAYAASEIGDTAKSVSHLESMLTLDLLENIGGPGSYGRATDRSMTATAIRSGLADEMLDALGNMHGVVALNEGGKITAISERNQTDADLLRIATNKDFDDQFQHQSSLVGEGLTETGIRRRTELLNSLDAEDLNVLANQAAEQKKNLDLAAGLSVKALELVPELGRATKPEVVAGIIADAIEYSNYADSTELINRCQSGLSDLREYRSAGLQPYRTNSDLTYILDKSLILLAAQGNTAGVAALISSSPHELAPGHTAEADRYHFNLDNILDSSVRDGDLRQEDSRRIRNELVALQTEKRQQLQRELIQNGATEADITKIIDSTDPDSAQNISAKFWKLEDLSRSEQDLFFGSPGSRSGDLNNTANMILKARSLGVNPVVINSALKRQIDKGHEDEEGYLKAIASIAEHYKDSLSDSVNHVAYSANTIVDLFSQFKDPVEAFEIASLVGQGEVTFDTAYFVKTLVLDGAYHSIDSELITIPPEEKESITSIFSNHEFTSLIAEGGLAYGLRDYVVRSVLQDTDRQTVLEKVTSVFSNQEFAELISENGAAYGLRDSLIKSILESGNIEATSNQIISIFRGGGSLWHTTSELAELSVGNSFYSKGATVDAIPTVLPIKSTNTYNADALQYASGEEMVQQLEEVWGVERSVAEDIRAHNGMVQIEMLPPELQKTLLAAYLYEAITISRDPEFRTTATQRNQNVRVGEIFSSGNLHHFTSSESLAAILQNGLLPGEFIADQLQADSYPFNVDFVESTPDVAYKPTYAERLTSLASNRFGDMCLHILREGEGVQRPGAEFAVGNGSYDNQHRLIPGGLTATEISAISLKSQERFASLKNALLEANMFIPIFDEHGTQIYGYEDFNNDRKDGNYDVVLPEIVDLKFQRPNSRSGSNEGAEFIVPGSAAGAETERYYCKFAQPDNAEHLWSELLSDSLYREVVPQLVPETKAVILEGRLARSSKMVAIDAEQVTNDARNEGFIMDCLIGNWDATYNAANLVMSGGHAMRIDTGNGLFFRARGERKPEGSFTEVVAELGVGGNQEELQQGMRQNYPGLTLEKIQSQTQALQERLTNDRVDTLVDGVRMPEEERATLKSILKARRDYIIAWSFQISAGELAA